MELTHEQVFQILSANQTHWLQIISWIAQILVLAALAYAAYAAHKQIEQNTKIAHAGLMLDLDKRWDSAEMQETRRLFTATSSDISKMVAEEIPRANDAGREARTREKWAEYLKHYRDHDVETYSKLMAMCGFFETVGVMVKKGYISERDMLDLFEGPIVAIGRCYKEHINERTQETGVPDGLYEHALKICDSANHGV